jgi:hypothetical protein
VITPGAVVGDVDPLFAARGGGDERAIDVEDRLVEEIGGLLAPDFEPGLIEDVLKGLDVVGAKRRQKSPAVVGSGIRSAPSASRKTTSLRRSSMSSRQVPLQRAL